MKALYPIFIASMISQLGCNSAKSNSKPTEPTIISTFPSAKEVSNEQLQEARKKQLEGINKDIDRLKKEGDNIDRLNKELAEKNKRSMDINRQATLVLSIIDLKREMLNMTDSEMKAKRPNYRQELAQMEEELNEIEKRLEVKNPK